MKVASAGLRAAQPQHRLLLRRTQARDRRLALEPRQPQCIQGALQLLPEETEKSLMSSSPEKKNDFCPLLLLNVACLQQVGQGLSRDGKALKLAFQHWIEAVSTNRTNPTIVLFVNLVVFALDLVRCFHVCEKRLLSVSVDLRVLVCVNTDHVLSCA
jgi:hypothetical protein